MNFKEDILRCVDTFTQITSKLGPIPGNAWGNWVSIGLGYNRTKPVVTRIYIKRNLPYGFRTYVTRVYIKRNLSYGFRTYVTHLFSNRILSYFYFCNIFIFLWNFTIIMIIYKLQLKKILEIEMSNL